ncbi:MAG: carbonic anhydrase family protein [Candidatus Korobacteraceae bacterium]
MKENPVRRAFIRNGACGAVALAAGSLLNLNIDASAQDQKQPASPPKGTALTQEWQQSLTPERIIELAKIGNQRFVSGQPIQRNYERDIHDTKKAQYPAAIVLSCIDSRAPAEIIFDAGIGNIFNARVAGNVADPDMAGSMEFACKVSGSKLVLVMGHTNCGAVKGAIDKVQLGNLTQLVEKIYPAVEATSNFPGDKSSKNLEYVDAVAAKNVQLTVQDIRKISPILAELEQQKKIMIVGAMYSVKTGKVDFL